MAKLTQSGPSNWETPQITPDQSATEFFGGMAPSKDDIIRSANARSMRRHEVKQQHLADMDVLPDSAELMGNEMVGIRDTGYIAKKNLEFGVNAMYNSLPPGMDIEDQEYCDIRRMQVVDVTGYNQVSRETGTSPRSPMQMRKGFARLNLLSSDDEYTREHNDAFYEEVTIEGESGFVERNNMLDRL